MGIGVKVLIFQDTKSRIGDMYNLSGTIISGPDIEGRFWVRYDTPKDYRLYVHPDDMRPLSKLDKVLE